MEPGDVLLFGNLLWHRSLPNRSDGIRWSLDARFYPEADAGAAELGNWNMPEPWRLRGREQPTSYAQWKSWTENFT